MKNLVLIPLFLSLFIISCSSNNLAVDYDTAYNFNTIKTYDYYTDNTLQLNKFDSLNFITSMDQALRSKGMIRDTNNPDVYIALHVYNQEGNKYNSVNLGIGGRSGWFGMGTSIGIPIKNKVMYYHIQVDFDDAKTKDLIWTGKTSNSISYNASTESRNSFYKSNIQSLLKKYPPKQKSSKKNNYYN